MSPQPARTLAELLAGLPLLARRGALSTPVSAVTYDSRAVAPGCLFIALRGARFDGHAFLGQAVAQGAAALLVEVPPAQVPAGPVVVQLADTRAALAVVARRFFGDPSRALRLAGVTGTNGKTTFTYLLETVLQSAGRSAGLIGTLGVRWPGQTRPTRNTTPESLELQQLLRQMVDDGVGDVALEVSSHALASHRVDGLHFAVRLFSNLTRDHLDLHGTEEAYFQAKRRLFLEFGEGPCWSNLDDPWGARLAREVPGCLGFSALGAPGATLRVVRTLPEPDGLRAVVEGPAGEVELCSPLVGRFNLENVLGVAAAALSLGVPTEALVAGLATAQGAPGRLQRIADPAGEVEVYVDYAHTPDALARVLDELQARASRRGGRVITLFGCGGERDRGKRPEMGAVAAARSGLLFVTDDNPRGEDPAQIRGEILAGIPAGAALQVVPGRAAAIAQAVAEARPGDLVLLAGKGHEDYQEQAGVRSPFDDADHARAALVRRSER